MLLASLASSHSASELPNEVGDHATAFAGEDERLIKPSDGKRHAIAAMSRPRRCARVVWEVASIGLGIASLYVYEQLETFPRCGRIQPC